MKKILLWGLALLAVLGLAAQGEKPRLLTDESWVRYTLRHPLHTMEATSKEVTYGLALDTARREIRSVSALVDVTTFDSGNSNRDSHAMEVIDAITYPSVTFTSTSILNHSDSLAIAGNLTFHGITKQVQAGGIAQWSAEKLVVRGNFDVSLTAFSIDRPSLLMMPVDDTLRFSFLAAFALK